MEYRPEDRATWLGDLSRLKQAIEDLRGLETKALEAAKLHVETKYEQEIKDEAERLFREWSGEIIQLLVSVADEVDTEMRRPRADRFGEA